MYSNVNSPVRFLYYGQHTKRYTGFKIRFSIHSPLELPQILQTNESASTVFNCSVPFYDMFSQHMECNLETECLHAEDESRCLYSGGACEPGFLSAGIKCYKYIKTTKIMTWYDAASVCLKQGLALSSMPTLKQLDEFRDNILRFAQTPFKVIIGLRTSDISLPAIYREVLTWSTKVMAYYVRFKDKVFKPSCASFAALTRDISQTMCGFYEHMQYIFCETHTSMATGKIHWPSLELNFTFGLDNSTRLVTCSEGHVMHNFLSCDHASRCGAELDAVSCVVNSSVVSGTVDGRLEILMYVCDSQSQTIHYTQVCDFQAQCLDSSDESFCIHQACTDKQCLNGQCISTAQWCDGKAHCSDGSDEACYQFVIGSSESTSSSTSGFHAVLFDGYGRYKYVPQGNEFPVCPQTHFLCADGKLCLPVYLRCNSVYDCWGREDEDTCENVTCPGYYRCRGSAVCIHQDHVCDGLFQCPQQDDELLCHLTCPQNCSCQGLAFVCPRPFDVEAFSDLRYLDSSQSTLNPKRLVHSYLIRLSLARCGLYALPVFELPNLKFLDLANNLLTNINMNVFLKLSNLNSISLSGNPIARIVALEANTVLDKFHSLDLSHTKLKYFESEMFYSIHDIKVLNLSYSSLETISKSGFRSLTRIESLDLRGTELKDYPVKMLQPLSSLRVMFSAVYKLCCQDVLPEQLKPHNCQSSPDEISSCKDLLRSDIYRMSLWITCSVAIIGNVGSFCSRFYMERRKPRNSFGVFIANLNFADFFMGLFLAIVGSADQVYRGTYLWHGETWKTNAACQIAGFFSLLSSEVSAFIICFITLDRFLVVHFHFNQLRFRNTSSKVVCGLCWMVGVALATLPLLPVTSHWEFYSQNDVCIPLPITRQRFKGKFYSFAILIVLNFLLFVFIAVGQLFIYLSVRGNSLATDQKSSCEATVARRLMTVVISNFLCWFPIGLLGLMSSCGIPIPGEVNVAMAIFALPLNSALNPFLYTFNLVMEKRQKASEERLLKLLQLKYSG